MEERNIVETALENLEKHTGIPGDWNPMETQFWDGHLRLYIDNQYFTFQTEVKKELRAAQMQHILKIANGNKPFMVVATRIFPALKEELRKNHIAYLEANGNLFVHLDQKLIWIETQKPIPSLKDAANRAFTPAGLKVVFHFLIQEGLINLPYREIAACTNTALGHINYVIQGLKEEGFLIPLTKDTYKLTRKKELFEKWIGAYHQKLKPTLLIDTFQFVNKDDTFNWQNIKLRVGETFWGGEPAGDLLTKYLNPGEFTMYTTETKMNLIKNYKILPAEKGNIKVYKKFWKEYNDLMRYVPEELVYADLINNNDRRSQETAQKIYDEYLQDKF